MKNLSIQALIALSMLLPSGAYAVDYTFGSWNVNVGDDDSKITMSHEGTEIFNDVKASATYNRAGEGTTYTISRDEIIPEVSVAPYTDTSFGEGSALVVKYTDNHGVTLTQSLAFFDDLPYFIALGTLTASDGATLQSNAIIPFETGEYSTPLGGDNNRILWVPFDNDGHGYYECNKIGATAIAGGKPSHEVGCAYNVDSRRAVVAGSVDHDNWKNGVTITGRYLRRITEFTCLSGLSNLYTRDVLPHGKVNGTEVKSARFMVGVFDDWRAGLDAFADANVKVAPPAKWDGGNPVGWSSYGAQQAEVNYEGVMESARFMKDELYPLGFHDRNDRITISLDACGEDNIAPSRLKSMATQAFGDGTTYRYNGQVYDGMNMILGLYGGPLTIWDWALDSQIPGTGENGIPRYTYRDMALKVNGDIYKVPSNGAVASDPTHPAVKAIITTFLKNYAARGAKYAKIDFMNCGMIQGDSYYDPEITTAVQAYNYAMKMVLEEADKYGIYLVMAMSPAFPYQYSHGRRTCCDRFSELGESQYVMNAISYGFWMDKLYTVPDPDQMVFCKRDYNKRETEGENRVRTTTGMTTGAFIFGDNFSVNCKDRNGNVIGYPEETMRRARIFMGNGDINAYVRENTGSFRPVEGEEYFYNLSGDRYASERIFYRHTDRYDYVAVFNFSKLVAQKGVVTWERLGVNPDNVGDIKELWFGSAMEAEADGLHFDVPKGDVCVYRIENSDYSGIGTTLAGSAASEPGADIVLGRDGGCNVICSEAMAGVDVYGIDGSLLGSAKVSDAREVSMHVACAPRIAIVKITLADGSVTVRKVRGY